MDHYDALSPPITVRKAPGAFPSADDFNQVNGPYHQKIRKKIREARARAEARTLMLEGADRSLRARKGVAGTQAFVPYAAYDDAVVRGWLGTPKEVEARFVEQTGTDVIPDDYLHNFDWQLRRINDGWRVIEDYENLTVVGHILSFRMKPDRAQRRLVLYEIITRPCAEGLAFFRIAFYQMLITCVQNGFELWVCSPLNRTQELMRRISPEHGVPIKTVVDHISSANELWIRLPMVELLSPEIVHRLGIAPHVEGDLMADHARRIRAVTPLAWVRIPRDPAVCREMVVEHLLAAGRRRQPLLREGGGGVQLLGYADAKTLLADLQELEGNVHISDVPAPDRVLGKPLTEQNDCTFDTRAWRFADPETAAAEVLRCTGDEVHVHQEDGTILGVWRAAADAEAAPPLKLLPRYSRRI